MTNNIFNLDDFRKDTGVNTTQSASLSIEEGAIIDTLFNENSPKLTGDDIYKILNNIYQKYTVTGLDQFMDWIQQESIENISLSRKSTIFAIAHLIDNPESNPSLYLLHSLNLANRSGKSDIINERSEYLKLTYNFDQLDDLIGIGKKLIQNELMTESELDIIEIQLTTHGRQRVLFSYL